MAQSLRNAVSQVEVRPPRIAAYVKGRERLAYRVVISLDLAKNGKPRAISGCSCGDGWMCEHAAAVMLALLRDKRLAVPVSTRPSRPASRDDDEQALPATALVANSARLIDVEPLPQLKIAKKKVFDLTFEDIELSGYQHDAFIKFPIAV